MTEVKRGLCLPCTVAVRRRTRCKAIIAGEAPALQTVAVRRRTRRKVIVAGVAPALPTVPNA